MPQSLTSQGKFASDDLSTEIFKSTNYMSGVFFLVFPLKFSYIFPSSETETALIDAVVHYYTRCLCVVSLSFTLLTAFFIAITDLAWDTRRRPAKKFQKISSL